jgi:hypothetical protein
MRVCHISLCVLVSLCFQARAAEDANVKKLIKAKVKEINDAVIKEDYVKVADLTYPGVVEMAGGRDKLIAVMKSGLKEMKSQGVTFQSGTVDEPSDIVTAGAEQYVVVPFMLTLKVPQGKLRQKSFVIGVSKDKGKTWTFVNGDLDLKQVKQILPKLPEKLKLPERQKPVLDKN